MGTLPIRRVNVEFLRPGRSHNQLLSPYTPYLAICNDAGVDTVRVPYEHRIFERRLKELRYETGDQSDRTNVLHEIGTDMGRLLESVPGLTGELAPDRDKTEALVHLRITLSAAELAMLPFELAFVPVGSSGSPVSIQPRPPISITRHIRTVSSDAIVWPSRPRILFIAGDPDNIPFEEHRAQLMAVIEPFQYPDRDEGVTTRQGREQFGDLLTILVNPSLANLQRECSDTRIVRSRPARRIGRPRRGVGRALHLRHRRSRPSPDGRHHCELRQRKRRVGDHSRRQLCARRPPGRHPLRRRRTVSPQQRGIDPARTPPL
jgi:hypothetical protein